MSEYIGHDIDGISVGIVEKKLFTFAEPPDEMVLDSGAKLGPITLAYETYGSLNSGRNNVILISHALSGDSHVADYYSSEDEKPGWWDIMIGPGKGMIRINISLSVQTLSAVAWVPPVPVPSIRKRSCPMRLIFLLSPSVIWSRPKKP